MTLRLIQLANDAQRFVAVLEPNRSARRLRGVTSTYELAMAAVHEGSSLQSAVTARLSEQRLDLDELITGSNASGLRWLPAIDHPDPAHLYLTGTGLTHLGSASSRDKMHAKAGATTAQSDSMRMFLMGLEGGKAADGAVGVQPEWFYKGDGSSIVASGDPLQSPSFALDGGEEPEIAGIYIIDPAGNPRRLGFCLANEFSDHVTERGNYLWLAHSKLRPAALGAELLTGALPDDVKGTSRILRGGKVVWERAFLTGETNMSHWISNLEHHHFKYPLFRRPGDVHVHFFGTATLSFADGVRAQQGDIFEIEADAFTLPLRNPLAPASTEAVHLTPL
ncbi:MAG: AraD1 family protein [Gammaproteobacteria bacterium]